MLLQESVFLAATGVLVLARRLGFGEEDKKIIAELLGAAVCSRCWNPNLINSSQLMRLSKS
jgi:hypothetical protein